VKSPENEKALVGARTESYNQTRQGYYNHYQLSRKRWASPNELLAALAEALVSATSSLHATPPVTCELPNKQSETIPQVTPNRLGSEGCSWHKFRRSQKEKTPFAGLVASLARLAPTARPFWSWWSLLRGGLR